MPVASIAAERRETDSGGPDRGHQPGQTDVSPPGRCPSDRLEAGLASLSGPRWEAETNVGHLLNDVAELQLAGMAPALLQGWP